MENKLVLIDSRTLYTLTGLSTVPFEECTRECWHNGNRILVVEEILGISVLQPYFRLLAQVQEKFRFHKIVGTVTVPAEFSMDAYLATQGESLWIADEHKITDARFPVVQKNGFFEPGTIFEVYLFEQCVDEVTSDECIEFLRGCGMDMHVYPLGAQGLVLTVQQLSDNLPEGFFYSYDYKAMLWKDRDGSVRIPFMSKSTTIDTIACAHWGNQHGRSGEFLLGFKKVG